MLAPTRLGCASSHICPHSLPDPPRNVAQDPRGWEGGSSTFPVLFDQVVGILQTWASLRRRDACSFVSLIRVGRVEGKVGGIYVLGYFFPPVSTAGKEKRTTPCFHREMGNGPLMTLRDSVWRRMFWGVS